MSQANALEELMLTLINEERSRANLDPLTFNGDLNEAAEDHSDWMLETDRFSHTGENGSSVRDRATDAGYELEGNWTIGENIGWESERGDPGLEDDVRDIHQSLMNSPGHRANILSTDYDEIGIGIERGDFDGFDGVMITQNFGATDADTPAPIPPVTPEPPVAEGPDTETPEPPVTEPPVTPEPPVEEPSQPEPPVAEGPDPETPEPPVVEEPTPETPVAEGPDPETPEPPVTEAPEEPFDVDAFIAELSALLEDLFANLNFGDWGGDDMITFDTVSSDNATEEAGTDMIWHCDTEDYAIDTSGTLAYDVDFF